VGCGPSPTSSVGFGAAAGVAEVQSGLSRVGSAWAARLAVGLVEQASAARASEARLRRR